MSTVAGKIVPWHDRRNAARTEVNQDAVTLSAGHSGAVSCVVTDISDTGARIIVENAQKLTAERFKLYIEETHQIVDCEQVWRSGDEIGLRIRSTANMA